MNRSWTVHCKARGNLTSCTDQCGQRSWKRYKNGAAFLERVEKGFLQIVTYSLQKAFLEHIEAAPFF